MHRPPAFGRATALMVSMAALMAGAFSAMPGKIAVNREQALDMLGGYKSNGKGKTKTHDRGGNRAAMRSATKRRNVARNRRAHRG